MEAVRGLNARGAVWALLPACLSLVACGASSKPTAKATAAAPPTPVQVATVSAPVGEGAIRATGVLRRVRESVLSFRIPGAMTRLTVDEGDTVRAGQVVAEIDATGVDARMRQAKAELDRARRDVDRFTPLVQKGAVSREQVENYQTAVVNAEAAYQSAGFDRRWAALRSPVSGVVLTRTAQAGEVLNAGQPVLTVADASSPLVLRAPLTDRDLARVRLGQSAIVHLDALPGQALPARTTRIGQRAGADTGQVIVEARLAPTSLLRSGMLGSIEIAAPASAGRASASYQRVPAEAVLEASGATAAVLRLDPTTLRVRRTPVGFGGFDGDAALISGL